LNERPKRNAVPIGDVIKAVFTRIEDEKSVSREYIENCWKQAAGDAGFGHSKPTDLKKGVLTIRVDSPVWMQELTMKKRFLLKALQRALGKDRISEINFKIGEF